MTALFADVVGSTSLGERLAPHEVKTLIGECVSRMSHAVEQFGGSVQSFMGDGIAAFFGVPTAHEDDPDRAAHAALRIVEVVAEYARDVSAAWGVDDFAVRVGINGGSMGVGVVGAADRQLVALGDATNVAARLQSAAAPGSIVVGEQTARRLAHRFVLESLGELHVKGREEAVQAWRLAGALDEPTHQAPTPLVGRESEVARLRVALDELQAGRGQLLLLTGEPGSARHGCSASSRRSPATAHLQLEGGARSFGDELLYWPFVRVLRGWLEVAPGEAEISVRTKLRSKLASLGSRDLDAGVARLGALLGLRAAAEERAQPRLDDRAPTSVSPSASGSRRSRARRPVVIALDDFQWADAPTRELAEALLDLTDRAPLLLAVAFATQPPSEATRLRLHAFEHYPHRTTELALEPLSAGESDDLRRDAAAGRARPGGARRSRRPRRRQPALPRGAPARADRGGRPRAPPAHVGADADAGDASCRPRSRGC